MLGGYSSSEESYDKKSDNESDYDPSESSDNNGDDNSSVNKGKTTMVTRKRKSRDESSSSVMISIPEAIKIRGRSSGVSIREPPPTDYSILDRSWSTRKRRDIVRIPNQRFDDQTHGSSSSSAANVSMAISGISQVNVHGGTIASEPWSISTSVPVRQEAQTDAIARSNLQESIFRSSSSSGSNNTRQQNSVFLESSSSLGVEAQAQANIIGSFTSSQPLPLPAMPSYLQQHSSSSSFSMGSEMAPLASTTQRASDLRLPNAQGIQNKNPNPKAVTKYNQAEMDTIRGLRGSLFGDLSSSIHGLNVVPGRDSTLVQPSSFKGNITSPSTENVHRPSSVSGTIPSSTLSNILRSSSSTSVEARTNIIGLGTSGVLTEQQQPPVLQDARDQSNEDESFDLNDETPRDEDLLDLNQLAQDQ